MSCVALQAHPSTPCTALRSIRVEHERRGGLRLRYRLHGDIGALVIPAAARPERTDGLWRHTCCELFVGDARGPGYREFNFSPSGLWAAYGFTDCRSGMHALDVPAPRIELLAGPAEMVLQVELDASAAPLDGANTRLGLFCVIESVDGSLSYWALAHPAARPDFHHPGSFALAPGAEPRA
jgi:hypothetical protein